jgi:hypothetical protein
MLNSYLVFQVFRDGFKKLLGVYQDEKAAKALESQTETSQIVVQPFALTGQDSLLQGTPVFVAFQAISPLEMLPEYEVKLVSQNEDFFRKQVAEMESAYQALVDTKYPDHYVLTVEEAISTHKLPLV